MALSDDTQLVLTGMGMPRWAARGLRISIIADLEPELWRDVNGTLRSTSSPANKYAVTISGSDQQPPAFAGLWAGQTVTMELPAPHAHLLAAGQNVATFERPFVAGTATAQLATTGAAHTVSAQDVEAKTVTVAAHASVDVFVFVRLSLSMMLSNWSDGIEEWQAGRPWSLSFREV